MLKNVVRSLVRSMGYDIRRHQMRNRFDAMEDVLAHLALQGLNPSSVVDVGANTGQWTQLARQHFPQAIFHLIEPQSECLHALQAQASSRVLIHPYAASAPHTERVSMGGHGTGAFVKLDEEGTIPAFTLDQILVSAPSPFLLKLDIQGYELEALSGATSTLERTDVVITEVSFFPIGEDEKRAAPVFADYFEFFHARGFRLYDIAALHGRRRDHRLVQGDCVFVRSGHQLLSDMNWS